MRYVFSLIISFFFFVIEVEAQKDDTICIKAKVVKIETIDYYKVISVTTIPGKESLKILSPLDEKNEIIKNFNDSTEIGVGKSYPFQIERMTRIKNGPDNYFLVNLRGFYYGERQLLKPGEQPYKALNVRGVTLYKCKTLN